MRRSYDTMAEAHVEPEAEAVIYGGANAVEGNSDDEEEDASDDDDEEEEDDDIIGIDDDDDSDNDDIILIDDDSDSDDVSSAEEDIPTPDQVEVEFTYPDDFQNRMWEDVVDDGQYFRLIIDCNNASITEIPDEKFKCCQLLIELVFLNNTDDSLINNENYLRRIGKRAFGYCYNLQRITNGLPLGLVELDDYAFYLCDSLSQEITIPRKVRIVGKLCFRGCCCITSVVFDHLPTDPVVDIRQEAFHSCIRLRSATLPPNLPSIPSRCFFGCVLLINIPIPIHVREIEDDAFYNCISLRSIDLSENIDGIHLMAYIFCDNLETVTIKSSTVEFGENCFRSCRSLTTIKVYPWVLPRLFQAMSNDSSFCYKLLRQSQYQLSRFRQR